MKQRRPLSAQRRLRAVLGLTFVLTTAFGASASTFPTLSRAQRLAIGRVALAEAADQSDAGLAAVIFVILNRLSSRRWGDQVDAILNAKGQFEPVVRAGGDWRRLPPPTAVQQARIDTVINLALDGQLPDLTRGAQYFQNPRLVTDRIRSGALDSNILRFGGRIPTTVIGQHEFFVGSTRPHSVTQGRQNNISPIFVTSLPGCLDRCP